jgi:hypothetical protein
MNTILEEFELFKGKSFSALCKDIVVNQNSKKDQLDILISDLKLMIKTANDAVIIVPLIRDYLDIGVKNDEQLVKLAAVVQRILNRNDEASDSDKSLVLTDAEREELMKEVSKIKDDVATAQVQSKRENIDNAHDK